MVRASWQSLLSTHTNPKRCNALDCSGIPTRIASAAARSFWRKCAKSLRDKHAWGEIGDSAIEAFAHFRQNDLAAAEAILVGMPEQSSALHLLGLVRVRQQRLPEAAELLERWVAIQPRESQAQFNLGKVLGVLGRRSEAVDAMRAALALSPALVDAYLILAKNLDALGCYDEAVESYLRFLSARPDEVGANLLVAAGRPQEAEPLLHEALHQTSDRRLCADLHKALADIQCRLRPADALVHIEQALQLDPGRTALESDRAALFEELHRFNDAQAAYIRILDREPANSRAHYAYNELLYRLGKEEEFLASYDRAPRTKELALARSLFLLNVERCAEAESLLSRCGRTLWR